MMKLRDRSGQKGSVCVLLLGTTFIASCLLWLLPAQGQAQDAAPFPQRVEERFPLQNQAGVRIGVWGHLGDDPIPADTSEDGLAYYETDLKDGSFFLEAYFGLRLSRLFMAEIGLGWVSRGDVNIFEDGNEYIGTLVAYPIELRGKFYALGKRNAKFQPYVQAGIGIFHVRNNIQFVTSDDFFVAYRGDSETSFLWMLGAGIDWPIARPIALDLQGTYRPIHLSREIFSIRDHDALTVTLGIKYLLPLEDTKRR